MCQLPELIVDEMRQIFGDTLNPQVQKALKPRRLPCRKPKNDAVKASSSVHAFDVSVYYEDTDFTGVVYYANYLKFMERARSNLFGLEALVALKQSSGLFFVIYSAELQFKNGAVHGDTLEIRTTYSMESDFRVIFEQDIYRKGKAGKESELLVKGKAVLVCLNENGQLTRLPELVRTL